ncbi:YkgJ family cysteine cluster protein [Stenoxybacter acetivorans]|uniref:YkgJ family cysteine cluster protein n=1 Tax=Stenoxybacter acetivorans TaxID=422441 RepID=UPI0005697CD9|nr:YkgJ family cysteine cluster protein [Stenoxybacter acetivorans]
MLNPPFPCNQCGQCCRHVHFSNETIYLNRGDGVCRYFDEASNLCTIYAQRPLICRVEDYYRIHYLKQYSWEQFIELNLTVCKTLQKAAD